MKISMKLQFKKNIFNKKIGRNISILVKMIASNLLLIILKNIYYGSQFILIIKYL